MNESRRAQVVLLDERRLDIVVSPRLDVQELLNIVASHHQLKDPDKSFFGLAFLDEKQQYHWLQSDRRVLDHDFPKKFLVPGATLFLCHSIKFFVDSITEVGQTSTAELFLFHAKQSIQRGLVLPVLEEMEELAALLLHIAHGDYVCEETGRRQLKQLLSLPREFLKEHPAFFGGDGEERALERYRQLTGLSKGAAVIKFMSLMEKFPTYGMHFYEVRDKAGVEWRLGISAKGIHQYEPTDGRKPRRVFHWRQLENLYYRDRKFSIEIHDPRRVVHTLSSFNLFEEAAAEQWQPEDELTTAICEPTTQVSVSRRAFAPSNIHVHVFFCESPQLCKTIWSIAIAQHQFYLDRKSAASKSQLPPPAPSRELEERLTRRLKSMASLESALLAPASPRPPPPPAGLSLTPSAPQLGSSASSSSLPSVRLGVTGPEKTEEEKQREMELYKALREKKDALEKSLVEKLKALKAVCVEEGEITGQLPKEIQRALAPGEPTPKIQRRVGTGTQIPTDLVDRLTKSDKADKIAQLEAEIELQRKICTATMKLAADRSTNKSVRKKRQKDSQQSQQKLKELEQQLHKLRISSSKPDISCVIQERGAWPNFAGLPVLNGQVPKSCPTTPRGSVPDLRAGEEDSASVVLGSPEVGRTYRLPLGGAPPFLGAPPPPSSFRRGGPALPLTAEVAATLKHSSSYPVSTASVPSSPVRQPPPPPPPGVRRSPDKVSFDIEEDSLSLDAPYDAGSVGSLPIYENIGYKSSNTYQSSYRAKKYPTLVSGPREGSGPSSSSTSRLSRCHRTHSEHSLQSLPPNPGEWDTVQPLPDFRTAGGEVVDHDVGAYNVPRQRTSWNYNSVEQGLNRMDSSDSLHSAGGGKPPLPPPPPGGARKYSAGFPPRSHSGSAAQQPRLVRKMSAGGIIGQSSTGANAALPPPAQHWTGSLDRRFLKNRSQTKLRQQPRFYPQFSAGLPPSSTPSVRELATGEETPDSGFGGGGGNLSVNTSESGLELTKSFETSDVLKYSSRSSRLNPQNGSPTATASPGSGSPMSPCRTPVRPMSPLVTGGGSPSRPPPPAYGGSPRARPANKSKSDCSFSTAREEQDLRKPKTATIV